MSKLKQMEVLMSRVELIKLIQQDIEDVKSLLNNKNYELSNELKKNLARAIILNLKDHLDEFIN